MLDAVRVLLERRASPARGRQQLHQEPVSVLAQRIERRQTIRGSDGLPGPSPACARPPASP